MLYRLVAQIYEDPSTNLQPPQHHGGLFHSTVAGAGRTGSTSYSGACSPEDRQFIAVNSDAPQADRGGGGNGNSADCRGRSRQFGTGRGGVHAVNGSPGSIPGGGGSAGAASGEGPAAIIGERAARAAKELWSLWPDIVFNGINSFQEEVRGRTVCVWVYGIIADSFGLSALPLKDLRRSLYPTKYVQSKHLHLGPGEDSWILFRKIFVHETGIFELGGYGTYVPVGSVGPVGLLYFLVVAPVVVCRHLTSRWKCVCSLRCFGCYGEGRGGTIKRPSLKCIVV